MTSSTIETEPAKAAYVVVSGESLTVTLADGRIVSTPLDWYPRLTHATPSERNHWELLGQGSGIHWPDLDEDLSVEAMLAGRRSMESKASFRDWPRQRKRR